MKTIGLITVVIVFFGVFSTKLKNQLRSEHIIVTDQLPSSIDKAFKRKIIQVTHLKAELIAFKVSPKIDYLVQADCIRNSPVRLSKLNIEDVRCTNNYRINFSK
jgi:hypothetical protein